MDRSLPQRFLPYGQQLVEDDDVEAVMRVLRSDFLTQGPAIEAFEERIRAVTGAHYAAALSSGTAALHLAYAAMDLAPGDIVIVPSITFVASASAARLVGAEVIFADVEPDTGLMRVPHLLDALDRSGARTKAVCLVHLNGQCADVAEIAEICRGRGLYMIEDACHALGTTFRHCDRDYTVGGCAHADMTIFSMHPVKTIAMGEGGVLTTNDEALYRRVARLRTHGITRDVAEFVQRDRAFDTDGAMNPWYYEMLELGFNYRASELHSALGTSQLAKLDRFVAVRRALASHYRKLLAPLAPAVRPVDEIPGCLPALHLFAVKVDFARIGIDRAHLMRALSAQQIGTQVHFMPVHRQPYYRTRYGAMALPGADSYSDNVLSLPLSARMDADDCARVVATLRAVINATSSQDCAHA